MKRLHLLSLAIIASSMSLFAGSAFDYAYWIIKDGKFTNNFNVIHYDDEAIKGSDDLVETSKDGVNAVEFRKKNTSFLDPRILFDTLNPLNLNTNYVMFWSI